MKLSWIPAYALSMALGSWLVRFLPDRWHARGIEGILVGMALFFAGFHRIMTRERPMLAPVRSRWIRAASIAGPVLARSLGFLGILLLLLYIHFEHRARIDITWTVLILAAWALSDALWMRRPGRPHGPSPGP